MMDKNYYAFFIIIKVEKEKDHAENMTILAPVSSAVIVKADDVQNAPTR